MQELYIRVIWYAFCLFVITNFLWFARFWLRHPSKWHIGYLSTSYALLCLLVSVNAGSFSEGWSILVGVIVMALGIAGLLQYWIADKVYGANNE
jgi:hypothetical protein